MSLRNRAKFRADAKRITRSYFDDLGFIETDTPLLVETLAVEPNIEPISVQIESEFTHEKFQKYLITSPELNMKRCLAADLPQIYQLSSVFRDGEITDQHLPEFTLLEWYRAHGKLEDLIADCQNIFRELSLRLTGSRQLTLKTGQTLDLSQNFEVLTVEEAWAKYAQIDLRAVLQNSELLREGFAEKKLPYLEPFDFESAYYYIMDQFIEPNIGFEKPCVLTKWPMQFAALAKRDPKDPLFAERFEIYAGGLELANAYNELTDPKEQHARFLADLRVRAKLGKKDLPVPEAFLRSLARMPNSVGIALGFDRLLMLLGGKDRVSEVQIFNETWLGAQR